jgi:hypothetical protein
MSVREFNDNYLDEEIKKYPLIKIEIYKELRLFIDD